ncbi:MAG: DUF6882 domain-containing protein [Hyphomonadaceae bacterium]
MRWLSNLALKTPAVAESRALVPWQGESVDVDRFWADAWRELKARQLSLARGMKLAAAQWSVDQETGLIHFDRADGAQLSAYVQIVGAWNPQSHVFAWGWDHPSVRTRLRADAERTRWFGEKHDLPELTQQTLVVSEQEAWRLSAVAMKVNAAAGVYRGPTDGPVVFMTMRDLKVQF